MLKKCVFALALACGLSAPAIADDYWGFLQETDIGLVGHGTFIYGSHDLFAAYPGGFHEIASGIWIESLDAQTVYYGSCLNSVSQEGWNVYLEPEDWDAWYVPEVGQDMRVCVWIELEAEVFDPVTQQWVWTQYTHTDWAYCTYGG